MSHHGFGYSLGLEVLNTVFFVFCASAAFIFLRYCWENRHYGYKAMQPLYAFTTFMIGSTMVRGSLAHARHLTNTHNTHPEYLYWITISGSIIAAIGVLCIIRTFSPRDWGHRPWVFALILAIVVTSIRILPQLISVIS